MRLFIVLGLATLVGCSTVTVPIYPPSPETNSILRDLRIDSPIFVEEIKTAKKPDMSCRAMGDLKLPNNLTPSSYIRKGLEDELRMLGVFSTKMGNATIGGVINKLEMSSSKGLTAGYWLIELNVTLSNGSAFTVTEHYDFESGFDGYTACSNASNAFAPAVQNLIKKVYSSGQFKEFLRSKHAN